MPPTQAAVPVSELPALVKAALSADNAVRKQAEARLAACSRNQEVVQALLELLVRAPEAQERHLAAILLRKRAALHWASLPPATREALKATLLDAIAREQSCVRLPPACVAFA